MSADLKRLQALAEPLKWGIWNAKDGGYPGQPKYKVFDMPCGKGGTCLASGDSLAPIRERLAAEYRERLRQNTINAEILAALNPSCQEGYLDDAWKRQLTAIADELSVPEEPTMVERNDVLTRVQLLRDKMHDQSTLAVAFDALIQFGERLDAIERGRE